MKNIYKYGFKFLVTHALSIALTLFCTYIFSWLIEKFGMGYFSIITALLYVGLIYSDSWNYGRFEAKPYNEIKANPVHALLSSIIPSIFGCILLLLLIFNISIPIVNTISKAWYMMFLGFYNPNAKITVIELILSIAVLPIISFVGYFIGTKNFSVLDKYGEYRHNRLVLKKQKIDNQREERRKERMKSKKYY